MLLLMMFEIFLNFPQKNKLTGSLMNLMSKLLANLNLTMLLEPLDNLRPQTLSLITQTLNRQKRGFQV